MHNPLGLNGGKGVRKKFSNFELSKSYYLIGQHSVRKGLFLQPLVPPRIPHSAFNGGIPVFGLPDGVPGFKPSWHAVDAGSYRMRLPGNFAGMRRAQFDFQENAGGKASP